ncbi:hypothetical protein KZ829_39355 [Actinoplanes hulinensis]|uniref:Asp23/Gls24 family envelope stress response protein n=1 Tax=Actinoplanes hulinensis TaxID=1144547 RepID=A0ABS7BFY9_9ACTN|nr:hypothetical protein [Actinoplanes hulinensis]MBW6439801.1 hypothetical protein [Actinoplanes hulinensis]
MTVAAATRLEAALIDGVDADAVASATRGCPDVEDLCGDPLGDIVTYLPGRRLPGVRIDREAVLVQVRSRWNVPAATVAHEIRGAVAGLAPGRRIDVTIADVSDPPALPTATADSGPETKPQRGVSRAHDAAP